MFISIYWGTKDIFFLLIKKQREKRKESLCFNSLSSGVDFSLLTRLKPDEFRMNFDPSQSLSTWQIYSLKKSLYYLCTNTFYSFLLLSTFFHSFILLFFFFLLLSTPFCSLFFLFFVLFSFSAFFIKRKKKSSLSLSIYTTGIRKQRSIKSRAVIFY